ncbi:NUDIX hydrolase [Balneolaceae bacterium YR4-1]|uniref:GDP-mannose pyrophosphatase n=1 Tax=Halalkalibaculum roseum TaxID=2709311 RepID=A0A6M1SW22_9BACT|nr:NUDIX hydrolase [Halalkalibaculum roseum]NGP75184.1 NUDIX hydrolase [Halalkalibaculum roseum]
MSESNFNYRIEPWSIVTENKEYKTPIFNLLKRSMKLQAVDETDRGDFYVLDAPEWINIIAITEDDEIILVEQYRYGIEEPTLEIPGGMVDEGEEPLQGAKREMLEETGYRSDTWSSLGKVSSNPAIMTNFTHMYLAKNCIFEGAENPDTHERINVHTMPVDDFLELVKNGTVHHAIVLAAVARYLLIEHG